MHYSIKWGTYITHCPVHRGSFIGDSSHYVCIFLCVYSLIKLSSPNLNYLIGVGAIILYLDIYLQVIPTTDPFVVELLCHLIPWLTAIGYSLCYGTIVVKMIRVHLIFTNPKPNLKSVRKISEVYDSVQTSNIFTESEGLETCIRSFYSGGH